MSYIKGKCWQECCVVFFFFLFQIVILWQDCCLTNLLVGVKYILMPHLSSLIKDEETGFMAHSGNWKVGGFTPERKLLFLENLMKNPSSGWAAKQAGTTYTTFLSHYQSDPEFKSRVDLAMTESKERHKGDIELTILSRAKEPNGFMDRMAWLRRHYAGEWSETKQVNHNLPPAFMDKVGGLAASYKVIDAKPVENEADGGNNVAEKGK